jgi:FSR family fosmidomycin resistance protein-like MFS transporter
LAETTAPSMTTSAAPAQAQVEATVFSVLLAVSFCHMLNDMMQSMLPAIYPMLKDSYGLDFWQIGLLTAVFQVTASLLQPAVGIYTDKRPLPRSLPIGMGSTFVGLIVLAFAPNYPMLLLGAALVGLGSSIFHPESTRVARLASGGRYGLAQSVFQVGGNFGSAIGPLLAAFIVVPHGQDSVSWFSAAALIGIVVLWQVGSWYGRYRVANARKRPASLTQSLSRRRIFWTMVVLAMLIFSKYIYMASISSYYTFYVIHKFGVDVQQAQILLFVFLGAVALGTILGGPIGDLVGTKTVIWFSILGVLPFTLALPYADLMWTTVLTVVIGLILASAFPAIIVFAQELLPGRVGMVAGIFFGFAFGMGGLGAAVLGIIADAKGINFVYFACSFLPAIGLLTIFLPNLKHRQAAPG